MEVLEFVAAVRGTVSVVARRRARRAFHDVVTLLKCVRLDGQRAFETVP
jgi:hypothetical protein